MKKIFIIIVMILIVPSKAFATQIDLFADKTSLSTDETVQIYVSVSGSVDNGQIGITGLESFDIMEKQSSQSIQIINGNTTQIHKKELVVKPKQSGKFVITALARDNGKEISSKSITINVQKSLIDTTKDKLLQNNQQQAMIQGNESNNVNDNKDIINTQKSSGNFDEDLLKRSQIDQKSSSEDDTSTAMENEDNQVLQVKQLKNFPKVEHISPFNMMFWIEFVGIILGLMLIIAGVYWIVKKRK